MKYTFTRPFRFLAPNQATLIGLVLGLIGIILIVTAQTTLMLWIAILILIISFITDRLDGQLSRYFDYMNHRLRGEDPLTPEAEAKMSLSKRVSHKGSTQLGKSLDPLVDKIRFVTLMWAINHGWIWEPICWIITFFAVSLTLIRHVNISRGYDDGSAKEGGKAKVIIEVVAIAALVFMTQPITGEPNPMLQYSNLLRTTLNILFILAMLGGMMSFVGHINTFRFGKKKAKEDELERRIRS
jgi:phosphatidylglycerophosphate synthase